MALNGLEWLNLFFFVHICAWVWCFIFFYSFEDVTMHKIIKMCGKRIFSVNKC